jgi:hypothetical protein
VYYKNKKGLKGLFNHSLQFLMFVGSGIYQPPKPPHANAWWVATTGPAANSNTAAAIAIMLNTTFVFVFIVI